MNPIERALRGVDRLQQRHRALAFLVAVQKKLGDDNGGTLIANLTYSGFVTVFPLLLALVTILGLVVGGSARLTHQIETSAVSQFPIVGSKLAENIRALHRSSGAGLAFGLAGTIWGATSLGQTAMFTMAQIWDVPGVSRPNFVSRLWRAFAFLGVLGVSVTVAGFLSGFGLVGGHGLVGVAAEAASALVNVGSYLLSFRLLTPAMVRNRQLVPGAIAAGIAWTAIEAAGGYLVARDLRHASAVYGTFALVLGLLAWTYLAARVAVYASEINVVAAYRLSPRAIVQPPLTEADRRSLALQITENIRRPEQRVSVSFEEVTPPGDAGPHAAETRDPSTPENAAGGEGGDSRPPRRKPSTRPTA